jgi:hypothetical protein
MALSEQRFIKTIDELPAITRKESPEKPPEPQKPPPSAKQLERDHKKKELAEQLAKREEELEALRKQMKED